MMLNMNGRATQLELTIDIDSDPITGSVAVGAGAAQGFSGWMELVATIESARQEGDAGVRGEVVGVTDGAEHHGA